MDFLFGYRKTPQEMLRQNQRALNRATRDLDRERFKMEQQEKKVLGDIKMMAKKGQMDAVKVMAKDLVRARQSVKKFVMLRANIQAVSLKIQTLKSQDTMAQAMKGVTTAMMSMNQQLKLPQIQKIMQEFEKQSTVMDMKEEMIGETIDDAMGGPSEDEDADQIVTQILDELGIQMNQEIAKIPAPGSTLPTASGAAGKTLQADGAAPDPDADLQARLVNLRKK